MATSELTRYDELSSAAIAASREEVEKHPARPSGVDTPRNCIFSVDVEDWFHILDVPSTPGLPEWDRMPSHVEKNFLKLLDLFAEKNAHVTCFFLGWVAEKFPHLVREAEQRRHEVASHGYAHRLVYQMGPKEFIQDASRSKKILEDIVGHQILGYRSPGFSVTEQTPYFFDGLIEAGYRYSSSVFPARRPPGGLKTAKYAPYLVSKNGTALIEFPITVKKVFFRPLCFFGGGYLRLFPYSLIRRMTLAVLREGRPVAFYVHPREVDPNHQRLPMKLTRRFKSYVNLGTTVGKIRQLLTDFQVTTFENFLAHHPALLGR